MEVETGRSGLHLQPMGLQQVRQAGFTSALSPGRREKGDPAAHSEHPAEYVLLEKIIEREIVSGLVGANRASRRPRPAVAPIDPNSLGNASQRGDQVESFVAALMGSSLNRAGAMVDALLSAGLPVQTMVLDLFGAAARRLGEGWEQDSLSFAELTIGMVRLQQLTALHAPAIARSEHPVSEGYRCFLTAPPGEMHTFGLFVAHTFLLRDGWDVALEFGLTRPEILEYVGQESFDAVCLTASCDRVLDALPALCEAIRRNSLNSNVAIVIGGGPFAANPGLAIELGADLAAVPCQELGTVLHRQVGSLQVLD